MSPIINLAVLFGNGADSPEGVGSLEKSEGNKFPDGRGAGEAPVTEQGMLERGKSWLRSLGAGRFAIDGIDFLDAAEVLEIRIRILKRNIQRVSYETWARLALEKNLTVETYREIMRPLSEMVHRARQLSLQVTRRQESIPQWERLHDEIHEMNNFLLPFLCLITEWEEAVQKKKEVDFSALLPVSSLSSLFNVLQQMHSALSRNKGIFVSFNPPVGFEALEFKGDVHADALFRILHNYVSNGEKYYNDKVRKGKRSIAVSVRQEGASLLFTVADNGMGMSSDDLERFREGKTGFRAKAAESLLVPGQGRGAAIAKNLIHSLGGLLEVDSELGKGTTIRFSIPLDIFKGQVSVPAASLVHSPVGSQERTSSASLLPSPASLPLGEEKNAEPETATFGGPMTLGALALMRNAEEAADQQEAPVAPLFSIIGTADESSVVHVGFRIVGVMSERPTDHALEKGGQLVLSKGEPPYPAGMKMPGAAVCPSIFSRSLPASFALRVLR